MGLRALFTPSERAAPPGRRLRVDQAAHAHLGGVRAALEHAPRIRQRLHAASVASAAAPQWPVQRELCPTLHRTAAQRPPRRHLRRRLGGDWLLTAAACLYRSCRFQTHGTARRCRRVSACKFRLARGLMPPTMPIGWPKVPKVTQKTTAC